MSICFDLAKLQNSVTEIFNQYIRVNGISNINLPKTEYIYIKVNGLSNINLPRDRVYIY